MSVNGTLVEAKMCTFTLESTHFIFIKSPIYTHDGASAKFSTNSHETDYSVALLVVPDGKSLSWWKLYIIFLIGWPPLLLRWIYIFGKAMEN